jgi:uncharacterized protein (TIGR03437 family)
LSRYLALLLLAALAFGRPLRGESSQRSTAPSYSSASIVNSATNTADALAPNAIATIYGTNLSYDTGAVSDGNIVNRMMPVMLAGVRVFVAGIAAPLYYVSPKQINFVIPSSIYPGEMDLFLSREGTGGPHVSITVRDVGPGLYQWEPGMIASTHADGSVITSGHPARAGEVVVLYGTGLGRTDPDVVSGQISMAAAQIVSLSGLRLLVAGTAVQAASLYYAGVTPGIPGLYQINVKLPAQMPPDPEIRVSIGGQTSPAAMKLPAR